MATFGLVLPETHPVKPCPFVIRQFQCVENESSGLAKQHRYKLSPLPVDVRRASPVQSASPPLLNGTSWKNSNGIWIHRSSAEPYRIDVLEKKRLLQKSLADRIGVLPPQNVGRRVISLPVLNGGPRDRAGLPLSEQQRELQNRLSVLEECFRKPEIIKPTVYRASSRIQELALPRKTQLAAVTVLRQPRTAGCQRSVLSRGPNFDRPGKSNLKLRRSNKAKTDVHMENGRTSATASTAGLQSEGRCCQIAHARTNQSPVSSNVNRSVEKLARKVAGNCSADVKDKGHVGSSLQLRQQISHEFVSRLTDGGDSELDAAALCLQKQKQVQELQEEGLQSAPDEVVEGIVDDSGWSEDLSGRCTSDPATEVEEEEDVVVQDSMPSSIRAQSVTEDRSDNSFDGRVNISEASIPDEVTDDDLSVGTCSKVLSEASASQLKPTSAVEMKEIADYAECECDVREEVKERTKAIDKEARYPPVAPGESLPDDIAEEFSDYVGDGAMDEAFSGDFQSDGACINDANAQGEPVHDARSLRREGIVSEGQKTVMNSSG